ncbi:hypothetical protein [Aurantiacibacter sp. D1-12]|uniref:hypothetical protein n=1 Tax=Aurantiacibacter sp. D1-12 TaxID=2993658 RepID=UPI00237C5B5D|nr:hypothetical protein [Aurantiacibacter sp. D1-12]MDE1466392.1 hypothetical protein [Aurantiacibacter sp. D1-12]
MSDEPDYLPDEWLIELGKVVKAWATFERMFDLMLQKLAGYNDPIDPFFTILTIHSSFPQRLDMFASLCEAHLHERPHLAEYKATLRDVKEAQRLRNMFMHQQIGPYENDQMVISKMSARGKLKMELRPVELSEITEAHEKIFLAGRSIYKLVLNAAPWEDGLT